jgi:hypothetical protein
MTGEISLEPKRSPAFIISSSKGPLRDEKLHGNISWLTNQIKIFNFGVLKLLYADSGQKQDFLISLFLDPKIGWHAQKTILFF